MRRSYMIHADLNLEVLFQQAGEDGIVGKVFAISASSLDLQNAYKSQTQ